MMYALLSALFKGAVFFGPFLIGNLIDHVRISRKEQQKGNSCERPTT